MKVSKEIVELAEKIKEYRIDTKLIEELKIEKGLQEKRIEELEEGIKKMKLATIKQIELMERTKELEEENKKLKLDFEWLKGAYTFIVTTPNEASNTVYGEICKELSNAEKEIRICSPWITYIVDELSTFKKKDRPFTIL